MLPVDSADAKHWDRSITHVSACSVARQLAVSTTQLLRGATRPGGRHLDLDQPRRPPTDVADRRQQSRRARQTAWEVPPHQGNAWFPPFRNFRCRSSVAVLPFRSRWRWERNCWKRLFVYIGMNRPERWLVIHQRQNGKNRIRSYLLRNGSYGATAGGNGNGTTEWWKPGITAQRYHHCSQRVFSTPSYDVISRKSLRFRRFRWVMGMKFERNVLHVNTHRVTGSFFRHVFSTNRKSIRYPDLRW